MFFITCFSKIEIDKNGWLDTGATRTFGYRETMESAVEALEKNMCDMHEFLYMYAVVEQLGPYIHPECESRQFFKYDKERDGFFPIDEPEEVKNVGNFALG